MYILSAETSTKKGTLALCKDADLLVELESDRQKSHSDIIHQLIQKALQQCHLKISDVDVFAAGLGPGSFTGLRIAGNTMKSFAYAFNKPMVALDSLTLMAHRFPQDGLISAWINAYKNMVYWALFEKKQGVLNTLQSPTVVKVQDLSAHISQPTWIVGDGYATYENFLPEELKKNCLRLSSESNATYDFPRASTLAHEAFRMTQNNKTMDWNLYQPLYIRASEAEETRNGILYTSLRSTNGIG